MSIPDEAIEAAHRAALNLGWTCVAHEPMDYGDCHQCNLGLDHLALHMLEAALPHLTASRNNSDQED